MNRDDGAAAHDQQCEERPRTRPAEADRDPVAQHVERAEDPNLERQAGFKRASSVAPDRELRNAMSTKERTMIDAIRTRLEAAVATTAVALAAVALVPSAVAATTTPTSPGACHMLDANAQGLAGMDGSQGGTNMVPLVVASLGAGCTP
jgi:hypothetical protein